MNNITEKEEASATYVACLPHTYYYISFEKDDNYQTSKPLYIVLTSLICFFFFFFSIVSTSYIF
jgi:hypothetical protein